MDFYFTINHSSIAEYKDTGSRFLAYAFPVDNKEAFKGKLKELKKEHNKASHHCYAYRIGLQGNYFRINDDGEPPGTAGKQILGQIDSKELINVAVVVVRYFGGLLLGIPGLISAYEAATVLALQLTPIVKKQVEVNYLLEFDYTQMNEVMRILKQFNCTILQQETQLFYRIKTGFSKNSLTQILDA